MYVKTIKFVPYSEDKQLFLASINYVGPGSLLPGFCTNPYNALRFDSASECDGFITMIECFIDYELGQELDVCGVELNELRYADSAGTVIKDKN